MQLTPNYKLKKPESTDPIDIQDLNDNADILDTELKKKADVSGGDISGMTVKTLDTVTTAFPVPVAGESSKTFLGKIKKFFEDTKSWMTGVCLLGQLVNNCVTDNPNLPLAAAQGKALMDLYTVLNTNFTKLGNDLMNKLAFYGHNVSNFNGQKSKLIITGTLPEQAFCIFGGTTATSTVMGTIFYSDANAESPMKYTSNGSFVLKVTYDGRKTVTCEVGVWFRGVVLSDCDFILSSL